MIFSSQGRNSQTEWIRNWVRSHLYPALAEVEIKLADLLRDEFTEPLDWIRTLGEGQQRAILGSWHVSKLAGVGIGPEATADLSALLNVVYKAENLQLLLGFESKTSFGNATGRLANLRNKIMHPVRPLVLSADDVAGLRRCAESLADLRKRLRTRLVEASG